MTPRTKHSLEPEGEPAASQFVNREGLLRSFSNALRGVEAAGDPYVLVYYGVGGIGKSRLIRRLRNEPPDAEEEAVLGGAVHARIDLRDAANRLPAKALERARAQFHEQGVRFPTFDIAFAVYWKLANPAVPLSVSELRFMDEGEIAGDVISALADVPVIGLVAKIPRVLDRAGRAARRWWTERGQQELARIAALGDANEVAEWLPAFFGADLRAWLAEVPVRRAVLFVDTHEAVFTERGSGESGEAPDAWLRDWAAHLSGTLVLVAGRNKLRWTDEDPTWEGLIEQHLVGALSEEDCERFLRGAGVGEPDVRAAITARSRGVPQYLDLAVDTYRLTPEGRAPAPDDFDANLGRLLDRFLSYAEELREALYVLSVPEWFDRTRFADLMRTFTTGVPPTGHGFSSVTRFSFVGELAPGRWAFHTLVREALAAEHDPEDRARVHRHLLAKARAALHDVEGLSITEEAREALREGVLHGLAVLEPEALCEWYGSAREPFARAAEWALLLPLREAVTSELERTLGPDHPDTLASLSHLGSLLKARGAFEEAEPLFRRALERSEKVLGPDHPHTLACLNNLGSLLQDRGRLDEAEPLLQRDLAGSQRVLGPDHPDTLTSLNNLAGLLQALGRLEEAERLFRRSLDGRERVLGPDHPDTLTSVNNLGSLLQARGRLDEAEPALRRAFEARERILGPDHPSTLTSLNNLAALLWARGRLQDAEPLLRRALEGRERRLGADHPSTVGSANNLAIVLQDLDRLEEAEILFRQALASRERVLGSEHPDTHYSADSYGAFLYVRGRPREAESLLRRALEGRERVLGPDHPHTLTSASNLAVVLHSQDRLDEAESLVRRTLEARERVLGPEHPDTRAVREALAGLQRERGEEP